MKTYPVERIRNVAVVGHGGVGKTSLVEALLFCAGATERMGRVDDGTATTDFDPEEVRRKITINAATAPLEWRDHKVNLIDTPGYPDFVGEAHAALRVADAALFVVDALSGVQVQTEKLWKVADQHGLPRLVVVNRLDRENAQFARAVESLQARFGAHVVPLQVPLGSETALRGVVDLVGMRAFTYEGGRAREAELPEDARDEALSWREKLLERAAESDDALLEKYLEQGELSEDELRGGLRAGVASGRVVPVVCAVATSGLGAQGVLDLVVDLVPSPADRPAEVSVDGQTLRPDPSGPLAALVFKTMADPYVGRLSYFRVYSGTLRSDSQVYNANKERAERVGQLYLLRGKQQIPVSEVPAGDLGAVAKLSETQTNDTLCSKDHPVRLRPVEFPR
ncbi:MAG: GTP-binding protein, partial [Armatimonadota bacterium]|nr:GTP-binding protein [Armatimonadota bacterium]